VALIPVSGRFSQYKSATTDGKGSFSLKGVAAGEYKMLAWDDIEPDAYLDPEFVKQFAVRATSVSLKENDRQNVTLKAISLDKPAGAAEDK
jgi:hypothetical protein